MNKLEKAARQALKAPEAPAQQKPVAHLPCCGYTDTSALQWNPYNGVAQCHNCGQVYAAPQSPAQSCCTCTKTADLHKAPAPAQQKPVAWLVCSTNPDGSLKVEHAATWKEAAHEHINDAIVEYEVSEAGSWIVQPAYTAPQPTENLHCKSTQKRLATLWGYEKARQPLTEEQAWENDEIMEVNADVGLVMGDLMRLVRAIEAAHGIGSTHG